MNRLVGKLVISVLMCAVVSAVYSSTTFADGVDGPNVADAIKGRLQVFDSKAEIVSCIARGYSVSGRDGVVSTTSMITASQAESNAWFIGAVGNDPLIHVSYYTDPDDGQWRCSDEINKNITAVLKSLNWNSRAEFFCGIGGIKINIQNNNTPYPTCMSNTADQYYGTSFPKSTDAQSVADKIDTNVGWKVDPSDAVRYIADWEALRLKCQLKTGAGSGAVLMKDLTGNTTLDGKQIDLLNTAAVTVVNKDGSTNFVRFPIGKLQSKFFSMARGDMLTSTTASEDDSGLMFGSCQAAADDMNKLSPQYILAQGVLSDEEKNDTSSAGSGATDSQPTCTVEGIGWIVCPVMNFMAGVNDTLFGALSSMLNVPPSIFTANSNTDKYADLYSAWNAFRGYANILFIVAFLIIIYSQITSAGITNYGIKKLLPKLIIAAILVNASYYLCQIAVDLSNILGYGLKSLFVAIGGGIPTTSDPSSDTSWAYNIGGALAVVGAAAGVIALVLAISVPVVLSGLLALLMVVIILIVRRAAIILLIVISPLAFVAWLLPNTEKWFKKWWDLFLSMLVLFPVISALFGAGALAGKILGSADFGDDAGVAKLAALGASVLPLFATIPLLQGALKATGAVGAKLSGMSAAANKRFTSGAQKTGKERYDNSSFAKGRALRKQGKEEYRNRRFAQAISGDDTGRLSRLRRKAALGITNGAIPNLTKRGGFAQDRVQSAAQAKLAAMEAEKHKEEQTEIANEAQKFRTMDSKAILAQATSADSSDIQRAAAIQHIMKVGSHTEKRDVLAAAHTTTAGGHAQSAAAEGYYSSGSNEFWGNGLGDKIKAGQKLDLDSEMKANFGNMSGATLLKSATSTAEIKRVAGTATDAELAKLSTAVAQVGTNTQLQAALTGNVGTDFSAIKGTVDAAAARSGGGTP